MVSHWFWVMQYSIAPSLSSPTLHLLLRCSISPYTSPHGCRFLLPASPLSRYYLLFPHVDWLLLHQYTHIQSITHMHIHTRKLLVPLLHHPWSPTDPPCDYSPDIHIYQSDHPTHTHTSYKHVNIMYSP